MRKLGVYPFRALSRTFSVTIVTGVSRLGRRRGQVKNRRLKSGLLAQRTHQVLDAATDLVLTPSELLSPRRACISRAFTASSRPTPSSDRRSSPLQRPSRAIRTVAPLADAT